MLTGGATMITTLGWGLPWGRLSLLLSLTLVGCAADRELAILRNDMERMNRQLLQLQVAQEVAQTKPKELVQREFEGERRNIADLKVGLDELRQQVSVLTERLEASEVQMSRRIGALEARLTPGSTPPPIGSRLAPPATGQTSSPIPPAGELSGSTPPAASGSAEARRLYQAALSDYQRGRFDLAAQGFRTYLEQAPRGDVADTAQYYLGESLYSAKDYHAAIDEFERLVREFPQSPQVPSALLKTGYAYYETKDNIQGRRTLRTLVEKYPNSKEAKLAEERLRLEDRTGAGRPPGGAPPR
jgi:tol-pal system protein YbgF